MCWYAHIDRSELQCTTGSTTYINFHGVFIFPGYISGSIKLLIPLLDGSKDYDVRVAVLTCIGTIFEASLRPDELVEWVGPRPSDGSHGAVTPVVDAGSTAVSTGSEPSAVVSGSATACPGYLVDRVLLAAETVSQPVVVKVEAMQALCKLIDTHPLAALPALPRAIVMAKTCATDTDGSLRLHAAKVGVVRSCTWSCCVSCSSSQSLMSSPHGCSVMAPSHFYYSSLIVSCLCLYFEHSLTSV